MKIDRVLPSQRRVLAAVVDLLLPPSPELEAQTRRRVAEDATRFVVVEVESMPKFLRMPYLLAIVAFQWSAMARYARPCSRLASEQRQAYLSLWSHSRVGPLRDFVKLIRSCALLAYFDHPEVRAVLERGRAAHLAAHEERLRMVAE